MQSKNELEPRRRNELGPGLHLSKAQTWVIVLALLYWICPIDLIPLIPIDDIIVMVAAIALASVLGLFGRGE